MNVKKDREQSVCIPIKGLSEGLGEKNELGELAPIERMNNPRGLWVKQE